MFRKQQEMRLCNIEAPKYIKKVLVNFKGDIDSNTVIVGNFKTPPSSIDGSSR